VDNPLIWQRQQFRKPRGRTSLVAFAGDTLIGFPDGRELRIEPALVEHLAECDHVIVNQEGALTTAPGAKARPYGVHPRFVTGLKALGVSAAVLANNHVLDHGPQGLRETVDVLHRSGIRTVGAGQTPADAAEPLVLDLPSGPLALVAFFHYRPRPPARFPGPRRLELSTAAEQIASLRHRGRTVCVIYHGGEEFSGIPWPRRRGLLRSLVRAGAQMVVAHHPHVVQGMELYGGRPIAYSLGNFYFNSYHRIFAGTDVGLVLGIELDREGPFATRHLFTLADRDHAALSILRGPARDTGEDLLRQFQGLVRNEYAYARAWRRESLMRLLGRILNPREPDQNRARYAWLRVRIALHLIRQGFGAQENRDMFSAAVHGLIEGVVHLSLGGRPQLIFTQET
jgi:hypothetical protein